MEALPAPAVKLLRLAGEFNNGLLFGVSFRHRCGKLRDLATSFLRDFSTFNPKFCWQSRTKLQSRACFCECVLAVVGFTKGATLDCLRLGKFYTFVARNVEKSVYTKCFLWQFLGANFSSFWLR